MIEANEAIRQKAFQRLANIFKIPIDSLHGEMQFQDLNPSFISIIKRNEFDIIHDDIRDVASAQIIKKLQNGDLEIKTIDDYVDHMISCYSENPKMVINVLGEL